MRLLFLILLITSLGKLSAQSQSLDSSTIVTKNSRQSVTTEKVLKLLKSKQSSKKPRIVTRSQSEKVTAIIEKKLFQPREIPAKIVTIADPEAIKTTNKIKSRFRKNYK